MIKVTYLMCIYFWHLWIGVAFFKFNTMQQGGGNEVMDVFIVLY